MLDVRLFKGSRSDHYIVSFLEPRLDFLKLLDRHLVIRISITDHSAAGDSNSFPNCPSLSASRIFPDHLNRVVLMGERGDTFACAVCAVGRDDDFIGALSAF